MRMNEGSDQLLILALRAGDREAFRLVYERYKGDVLALLAVMLGRQEGAWDLLHDVFVSLAGRAASLPPGSNLKGYLLTAAANRARDYLTRRRETPAPPDVAERMPTAAGSEPWAIASRKEEAVGLRQALLDLPDEQRIVAALRIYGGLTLKEIAEREGVSENTAQSRYRYALEKLRRCALREQNDERVQRHRTSLGGPDLGRAGGG
jgi:RNA polymerase sigma factor (sigma-70 family)